MQPLRPGPFRGDVVGQQLNFDPPGYQPLGATALDCGPIRLQSGRTDVFQNLLLTTLAALTTVVTREPLYTPGRAALTRHEEPIQNLQQTMFATQAPTTDPAINVWYSRPVRLPTSREGYGGTSLQLFPPQTATTPVLNYDLGRAAQSGQRRDDSIRSSPFTAARFSQTDFSRPLGVSPQRTDVAGINLQIFPPVPPAASPVVNVDYSIPQRAGINRQEEVGLNIQLFPPVISTPFVQPDLGARPQARYSRVDGPLGQPLLIAFPLPPSVLPFNTFDVSARPVQNLSRNQEGQSVNVQLFPPTVIPDVPIVPPPPAGRKHRQRQFIEIDGHLFEVSGAQEALALLKKARAMAMAELPKQIDAAVAAKSPKIKAPMIRTERVLAAPELKELRIEITDMYRVARQTAETRILLDAAAAREEEETILKLLL